MSKMPAIGDQSVAPEQEKKETPKRFDEVFVELANFKENLLEKYPDIDEDTKMKLNFFTLTDRTKRGLNAVSFMAVEELRCKTEELCEKFGCKPEELLKMAVNIQVGGPWDYAKDFTSGENPVAKAWMSMQFSCREREIDFTPTEFTEDLERISGQLDKASESPEEYYKTASKRVMANAKERFRTEDGVPISEMDNGFMQMAIMGHEAGVITDSDGLPFVGAKVVDDKIFEEWGLKKVRREDRGRESDFWVNEGGDELVKKVHPGFVIVLSKDLELAKAIVQSVTKGKAVEVEPEVLGHKIYTPTSMAKGELESDKHEDATTVLKRILKPEPKEYDGSSAELARPMDMFYEKLAYVKGRVTFIDEAGIGRKKSLAKFAKKRKTEGEEIEDAMKRVAADPELKEELMEAEEVSLDKIAGKRVEKVKQKIEEVKYLVDIMDQHIPSLPENVTKIMDMAGGAGDLGLAVGMDFMRRGRQVDEISIVDPVAELQSFTEVIVANLPFQADFERAVTRDLRPLQEVSFDKNSVVVAKHACGDLSDSIIENWVESESPMLVIMTCCQDKACNHPARYDITQDDWKKWCKESSKTNSQSEKKKKQGMEAMTNLDEARVEYLKRHGFDAKLYQTDQFPKGDVIVAVRK